MPDETTTTTIRIKGEKLKEAKHAAIDWDISLSELIEEGIDLWIKGKKKEEKGK